ncbi:outer dynein arm-docking complex subunit 4-like isoform X2 [Symsagittifera roscoffensis]|uniref:outer dynein arm-docking complex subunit 4-like isoform X2 n=1 Tax=Symsagittifera roscoffensis TaxID=84072 RepID=UPI00307CA0A3
MPLPKAENDDDSHSEIKEVPKSSSVTYFAEGDKLYRKNEFRKAIESYTAALDQAEKEEVDLKASYIARALCHLHLGDSDSALADAEEALELEQTYTKGLWVKAEALYAMGDFEYALLFYHRGFQARSDFAEFRIGIQKSQEAIENAIGKDDNQDLSSEGDLGMYFNRDLTQNYITFSEKRAKEKKGGAGAKKEQDKRKDDQGRRGSSKGGQRDQKTSKKNSKKLLGQLYSDKEFLQKLLEDETITNPETDSGKKIQEVTSSTLEYLDKREEFWRQQNPSRLHSKKQERTSSGRVVTSANLKKNDPQRYIHRQLDRIEEDLEKKKFKQAEKRSKETIDEAKSYDENDLANKQEILATLYSLQGIAQLEQGKLAAAETSFKKDFEISDEMGHFDGSSRALDNLGRVSVKLEKFDKAIQYWESKLQLLHQNRTTQQTPKSQTREGGGDGAAGGGEGGEKRGESRAKTATEMALERTWLYHEIGRCHLELKNNSEAKEYGERALASAKASGDEVWQINALVLSGKAEAQMEEYQAAAESYEKALELAKEQGAKNAQKAIESALKDVNNKIVRGVKTEEDAENEEEKESPPPEQAKKEPEPDKPKKGEGDSPKETDRSAAGSTDAQEKK